jgi:hypothetical protein
VFGLLGGLGPDLALRRAARATLLVLVATWLRLAAGSTGLREVGRRVLGRLRRVPAMREAADDLDALGSDPRLGESGRALVRALARVPKRPLPVADAVLGWVRGEARRFPAASPAWPPGQTRV